MTVIVDDHVVDHTITISTRLQAQMTMFRLLVVHVEAVAVVVKVAIPVKAHRLTVGRVKHHRRHEILVPFIRQL